METDTRPEETDTQPMETDTQPMETDSKPMETDSKPEETDSKPEETDSKPEEAKKPFYKEVDLKCRYNNYEHHTIEFSEDQLIVRRGQTFDMTLTLEETTTISEDELLFITVTTGDKPKEEDGTLSYLSVPPDAVEVSPSAKATWKLRIGEKISDTVYDLRLTPPADAPIGEYKLYATYKGDEYHVATPVVLFNPWCPADSVFMFQREETQEYVMNEQGVIYRGSGNYIHPLNWDFGQFEDSMIEICMKMLNLSHKHKEDPVADVAARCDPIYVSRIISAMINSQDDRGVLEGNWTGRYAGGKSPSHWTSSFAILSQWLKYDHHPVKYGQCWVFAAVMCSVMRALGIPCRVVTNFQSAHDTDMNLTIDTYHADYGVPEWMERESYDSVWNFHVWTEGWMRRPDLSDEGIYDGWQVVDPTPQELSGGVYCCGPASVKAILLGETALPYDVPFVFAEVNADCVDWLIKADGSYVKIWSDTGRVGQNISTKSVGAKKRQNITDTYKHREGSDEERAVFVYACKDYSDGANWEEGEEEEEEEGEGEEEVEEEDIEGDNEETDETSGGADAGTPGATPGGADAGTPGATPGGADAGTPGATPGDADAGTPGATPGGADAGTPGATPGGADAGTPGATPGGADAGTPGATPGGADAGTPGATPGGADAGTPGATPGGADAGTPGATPGGVDAGTPGATPGGADAGTPGATPGGSDAGAPGATPGGADAGAPGATPGGSDAGTPGATPGGADAEPPKFTLSMAFKEVSPPQNGKKVSLKLVLKSKTNVARQLSIKISVQAMVYNNLPAKNILTKMVEKTLRPGKKLSIPIKVPFSVYKEPMLDRDSMKISALVEDKDNPENTFLAEDDVVLIDPPLKITMPAELKKGWQAACEIIFKNPIKEKLTSCTLSIAGSGLVRGESIFQMPDLNPDQKLLVKFLFVPQKIGVKTLMLDFDCSAFRDIKGSCEVKVVA